MKIYIDKDCLCHAEAGEGLEAVETEFFDGKAAGYIAGYRFIPSGQSWTDENGITFTGEMIAPWKDWAELDKIQRAYEQEQAAALNHQNAELLDAMASMVEDVYRQDLAVIEEG